MSMYNGNEFDSEKGTQGGLLKFIWSKIYDKFTDVSAAISTALGNYYTKSEVDTKDATIAASVVAEATARTNAISALQSTLQTAIDEKTTTAEVATQITTAIDALVAGAPAALDTLKEISDALAANEAGDTETATALNALITTVAGKASQESVDALAGVVGDKTDKSKTNELKGIVALSFSEIIELIKMYSSRFLKIDFPYQLKSDGSIAAQLNQQAWGIIEFVSFVNSTLGIHLRFQKEISPATDWSQVALVDKADYDVIIATSGDIANIIFNPNIVSNVATAANIINYVEVNNLEAINDYIDNDTTGVGSNGTLSTFSA